MVWADDFAGPILDESVWNIEEGGGGWGNKELQYYTNRTENLRIEDGCLVIEARKENYGNRSYTSARINTREKKAFEYGKIEARISLPSGGGTWPAFWMMGNDYRKVGWPKCGEIDIMEHVGNKPSMVSYAIHTPQKNGSSGNNWYSQSYFDDVENNFHVYGIEWIKEEKYGCDVIHFTFDGKITATIQEDISHIDENYYWPFNKEHFIIFNLAIGGTMGGSVDDAIFNQQRIMYVDWVRVYQRQEQP
jgi:beta-glucanase (GH16 family)